MSARPWRVWRCCWDMDDPHPTWVASDPAECGDGDCRCKSFPTHAEAIAYADRQARGPVGIKASDPWPHPYPCDCGMSLDWHYAKSMASAMDRVFGTSFQARTEQEPCS